MWSQSSTARFSKAKWLFSAREPSQLSPVTMYGDCQHRMLSLRSNPCAGPGIGKAQTNIKESPLSKTQYQSTSGPTAQIRVKKRENERGGGGGEGQTWISITGRIRLCLPLSGVGGR